jgi:hypothetical protein
MNTPLRDLIAAEPDVRAVLELEPIAGTDDWRYLIETPFATFPRYAIGRTDATLSRVRITHRCGHIDTAREAWTEASQS